MLVIVVRRTRLYIIIPFIYVMKINRLMEQTQTQTNTDYIYTLLKQQILYRKNCIGLHLKLAADRFK